MPYHVRLNLKVIRLLNIVQDKMNMPKHKKKQEPQIIYLKNTTKITMLKIK